MDGTSRQSNSGRTWEVAGTWGGEGGRGLPFFLVERGEWNGRDEMGTRDRKLPILGPPRSPEAGLLSVRGAGCSLQVKLSHCRASPKLGENLQCGRV